jgi:UDP-N-acetylmuramate dehydrogenase
MQADVQEPGPALASMTTLRVGGPVRRLITVTTADAAVDVIRDVDARKEPLLVIGGGSNLLVGDEGFDGTALRIADESFDNDATACAGAFITVGAGHDWDRFVQRCVEQEFIGVECLSGIPGSVGATPIQNVGAYGQEVADTIARVRTYDRDSQKIVTHFGTDCVFSYRDSRFKRERMPDGSPRWIVLSVAFQLALGSQSAPVMYPELARALGIDVGATAPLGDVRRAVLALRAGKGMVLDANDHDTWSAGSFFTNPILESEAALPTDAPRWPMPDGRVKTSAAWLVENAGFGKGFGLNDRATLSTKHTLALTNRGSASAHDLLELRDHIHDGVAERFGLHLETEPVIIAQA